MQNIQIFVFQVNWNFKQMKWVRHLGWRLAKRVVWRVLF